MNPTFWDLVEVSTDQPSHEARLVIDRWDAIYFP